MKAHFVLHDIGALNMSKFQANQSTVVIRQWLLALKYNL